MKKLVLYTIVTLNASVPAFGQNALDFDGIDDFVTTIYAGVMGSANRTFEAWVFVPSSAPASNLCILDYGLNQAGSRNTFSVSGNRGLTFISGGVNTNISTPANTVPLNQWAHVAFVLDNGTGFLYVNGVQQGTGNLTNVNTPPGNQNVQIGERVIGSSIPFQGKIDEVRVWSLARSAAEIQANMNDELCSVQPGLALYLRFNEGVAGGNNMNVTMTIDDSGNLYGLSFGTLNGFSLMGFSSNFVTGASLASGLSYSFGYETACNSYTWTADSTVYTASGLYSAVIAGANAHGCDSIAKVVLTIDTVDTSVTDNGDLTITANANNASYQWLDCDSSFAVIAGATDQTLVTPGNGNYAVQVTENDCTDTSACVTINSSGIGVFEDLGPISLYPNPTNESITLTFEGRISGGNAEIIDASGRIIMSIPLTGIKQKTFDLEGPDGLYLIRISDAQDHIAMFRVVKE